MASTLVRFAKITGPAVLLVVCVAAGGSAASGAGSPPATISAVPLHPRAGTLVPGSVVRSASLGVRVFSDASHGFALANVSGTTYPATTVNGGTTWKVNGPVLHLPAAQAPLVVTQVGAFSAREYFAWAGPEGGQVVDVTSDAGKHWYQAILGDVVMAVVAGRHGRLIAFAQQAASSSSSRATTSVYVSTDGGRHWLYNDLLGAA